MKNKHERNKSHADLQRKIYQEIKSTVNFNSNTFALKVALKFALMAVLILLTYTTIINSNSILQLYISYVIYGLLLVLVAFNFSHDFSHSNVFRSKKLNEIGYLISFILVGAHSEGWKHRHINSHHFAPNVQGHDSDLEITNLIRVIPNSDYRWFHKYQHLYAPLAYTSYSFFWVFIKDFIILYSKNDGNENKDLKYHLSFWIQKMTYVSLLVIVPIAILPMPWFVVLGGFLTMHVTQSLFLLYTFFMTHHVMTTAYPETDELGKINTSWVMNQILSSNDMNPFCKLTNFVLGGFNCHIAHHLFPNIHHVYYPAINTIIYRILREHNIEPNHTSYWGGVVSHMRLLKNMSQEPIQESINLSSQ